MGGLSLYVIAGEPSGDRLGGALMRALSARQTVQFRGVGGVDMTAAGLSSRFEMSELTVMGLSEVLPKLPQLMRRIRETADNVIATRPDALVTIDSPDFTLRVAKRVREALPHLKIIHYVAPSVWAWRPGRAVKMARSVDHVLALLPFEPPYMHAAGMSCDFVGHPVAAMPQPSEDELLEWRARQGLAPDQKLLLIAPGSRHGEVNRLLWEFMDAVELLRKSVPDLAVVCPLAETVADKVRSNVDEWLPGTLYVAPGASDQKRLAFAAADAALCASGTVTLELAASGTPMVAAYRTTWLNAAIARRLLKVNSANLVNLISGKNAVPEFLQEFCSPDALAGALRPLVTDPSAHEAQRVAFDQVMAAMGRDGPAPEERAATSILSVIAGDVPRPLPDPNRYAALVQQGTGPLVRHRGRIGGS